MPRFLHNFRGRLSACLKCQHDAVETRFCETCDDEADEPHLHRTCRTCSYTWIERPMDLPDRQTFLAARLPSNSDVRVERVTTTLALVVWQTDKICAGRVEYGLVSGTYTTNTPLGDPHLAHAVLITGLLPATQYFLRVRSRDAQDNIAVSTEISFTTNAL